MATAPHMVDTVKELVFNQKIPVSGGRQIRRLLVDLQKSYKSEWAVEDIPCSRTIDRWLEEWLRDGKNNPNYIDWSGFDINESIGTKDHQIPWADARSAMDFYGFYASEAVRNFNAYDIDMTTWHPTLGLIKACVSVAHLMPDRDIYTQAQAGERVWVRRVFTENPSFKGKISNDFDELSIALRSWNHSSNSAQGQLIQATLNQLGANATWDLGGNDAVSLQLRKTAIGQMPLYRYNRLSNGESFLAWRAQYQADLTRSERQESFTESELPAPAPAQITDISLGINDIRELIVNLTREERLALANEIWNEV